MSANWKYRQELTKNADAIIKYNQTSKCLEQPVFDRTTLPYNAPFLYKSCGDANRPVGYESSDMKDQYLIKKEVRCRMVAPEIHYKGK